MQVIVCVDDNGGMMFNKRRQSRDRVLCEYVMRLSEGHQVYMSAYSAKLFSEDDRIVVSENYLEEASGEDFCFVEKEPLKAFENEIKKLIIFKWNRVYPADQYLDIDPEKMTKVQEEEFVGFPRKNYKGGL